MSIHKKAEKQSVTNKKYGITSIICLGICFAIMIGVVAFNYQVQQSLKKQTSLINYAIELREGSQYLTSEVRAYAATGEKVYYDNYWNEVNTVKSRESAIAAMKEIGITEGEENQIEAIGSLSNNLIPLEEEAMAAVEGGDLSEAVSLVYGQEYVDGIEKIKADTETFIMTVSDRAQQESGNWTAAGFVIECIGIIALLVTIYLQTRYLRFVRKELLEPVQQISSQMQEMAQGNLSAEFFLEENESEVGMLSASIHSTKMFLQDVIGDLTQIVELISQGDFTFLVQAGYVGEFAVIKESLETFRVKMCETFHSIQIASEQVSEGAEQIAAASLDLAEGSSEEAGATEELAKSVGEVASGVKETAEQSDESKRQAATAGEQLQVGTQKMNELSTAMDLIKSCSSQIGEITSSINEIASQTNLLALNAAIEAARAGDAGKGFMVVANEVKNLANDSAKAVSRTDSLVQKTLDAVGNGIVLVEETLETLNTVGELAGDSIHSMEKVAKANNMQAVKIDSVMNNINKISESVQNSSAAAQETAATSQEQSAQSEELKALLASFKLR